LHLRRREEVYTEFWWGNLRERDHLQHLVIDHRWQHTIKMYLQEVGLGGMDWTDLAQDKDRWRVFVNVVMNIWVPHNAGSFLTR
jgi:hypothetical protein